MYNIVIKRNDWFYFALLTMCMFLGILTPNVSAQEMSKYADITGKVVDQYGNPVSDVTVTMKNSDFRVITGVDGVFKFQLKKGDILRLSHPGFLHKEVRVNKLKNTERVFKVTLDEQFVKDRQCSTGAKSKSSPQWVRMSATVSLICARHPAASKGRCASSANSFTSSTSTRVSLIRSWGSTLSMVSSTECHHQPPPLPAQCQRPRLGGA